ncbi:MAG: 3-hydroxy-3-methylglutaryl CoA synthase, partial [Dehalococcoidia bacterium]|nr:3-hydroxy-3-methylglutaryl CoA synthase [Dehalococcoidia bacterium]
MVGIISYGACIPRFRMSRDTIARAWGGESQGGERAVANYDEDSASMAASAVLDCLDDTPADTVDGLYFASTTSPYREKLSSALIAVVADMRRDVLTADFSNSLRCGTGALKAAMDALAGGSAKRLIVAAADCRLGAPGSNLEQSFGDGAAALLLGNSDVACSIEGSYSLSHEFTDFWRRAEDKFVRAGDPRFVRTYGYENTITDC